MPARWVIHCTTVRDKAAGATGKICAEVYLNPREQSRHWRAQFSFTSVSGQPLRRVRARALYLLVHHAKRVYRARPEVSATARVKKLALNSAWVVDNKATGTLYAVIQHPCLSWKNGGFACYKGSFRGTVPVWITS